ncbi:lysoplasmalogenase [Planococcus sp. APC 4015]|nr:lysoplasmalogenase [Planococcus sp. APC 4015]
MARLWAGFVPFAVLAAIHVVALALGADQIATPTKLLLMPLLAAGVVWCLQRNSWRMPASRLLLAAIALSWLGDGAGVLFPWAPTVPVMLLWFGVAHLCYIRLFWHHLRVRPLPVWTLVFAVWWGVLLAVLWPHLGGLLVPVALYGLILGGTAAAASRCHPLIVVGGLFFLASDSVLAFRLFVPDAMPDWTSPLVMLTYALGQGLMAAGSVIAIRARVTVTT